MKKINWLAAFLLVVSVFLGMTSCQPETEIKYVEVEKQPDGVAPADVTNLVATNKDASVLLTWTDATDEDIYGYEVTWNNNAPINRSAAMESNSMMVAPGAKGCYISNLTNGTEYAFTVKSVDTSGNKSAGVTKTITKKNTPTITVDAKKDNSLVPSTTEKTNQDVTVKVEINSEIAESVEKILYSDGLVMAALSGDDITESKEFVVPENKSYSVVIKYTDGTVEFFFIDINNIDINTLYKQYGSKHVSLEQFTDDIQDRILKIKEDENDTSGQKYILSVTYLYKKLPATYHYSIHNANKVRGIVKYVA